MKSRLAGISSHFIVCGYGRVGREVARALAAEDLQVVVVDSAVEAVGDAQDGGMLFVQGDATHDETLSAAGIEGAPGLIVATDDDSDNVLITLSARGLKSELTIVARGADAEAEAKLVRAGADRVVSVHRIAGRRMAWSAARPLAVEFFDTMTDRAASGVRFVEVEVVDDSPLANTSPQDLESSNGVQVLAISRKSGELLVSPPESTVIQSGDRVMLAGNDDQIQVLEGGA